MIVAFASVVLYVNLAGFERPRAPKGEGFQRLVPLTDDAAFESSAAGGSVVLTSDGPFVARVNGELVYRCLRR